MAAAKVPRRRLTSSCRCSPVRTEEARGLRWDHVVAWVGEQVRVVRVVNCADTCSACLHAARRVRSDRNLWASETLRPAVMESSAVRAACKGSFRGRLIVEGLGSAKRISTGQHTRGLGREGEISASVFTGQLTPPTGLVPMRHGPVRMNSLIEPPRTGRPGRRSRRHAFQILAYALFARQNSGSSSAARS